MEAEKEQKIEAGNNARLGNVIGKVSWVGKEILADKDKKIEARPAEARLVYLEQVHAQAPGSMIHGFDGLHFQVRSLKCLLKDLKAI